MGHIFLFHWSCGDYRKSNDHCLKKPVDPVIHPYEVSIAF